MSEMWRSIPGKFDKRFAIVGDVQRRHAHRYSVERREQFPISISVAISVEATAKTGAGELV
jgi:hypothetical protein